MLACAVRLVFCLRFVQFCVVIIVGATEGTTSTYRSYADSEYAEAIKYTPNVVKVYSPDATWEAVQAAVDGASIVIYHGHGNGCGSEGKMNKESGEGRGGD